MIIAIVILMFQAKYNVLRILGDLIWLPALENIDEYFIFFLIKNSSNFFKFNIYFSKVLLTIPESINMKFAYKETFGQNRIGQNHKQKILVQTVLFGGCRNVCLF